jgi:hypothetical protein
LNVAGRSKRFIHIRNLKSWAQYPPLSIHIPTDMESELTKVRISTIPIFGDQLKELVPEGYCAACAHEIANSLLIYGKHAVLDKLEGLMAAALDRDRTTGPGSHCLLILNPEEYRETT